LFSTNPTSNGLGLNPALRGDRPTKNLANDGTTPGLCENATEETVYTLWLNFEFCQFGVRRTAYDGGLRLGRNFEVYVFLGVGGEKYVVLLRNRVKHLSNWPVIGSSGCIVTTIQ